MITKIKPKKHHPYISIGAIFAVLLVSAFIVNTFTFYKELNTVSSTFLSNQNKQISKNISDKINLQNELLQEIAISLSHMPSFAVTDEFLERKKEILEAEALLILVKNEDGNYTTYGDDFNFTSWISENPDVFNQPMLTTIDTSTIVNSAPIIGDTNNSILLSTHSYKNLRSLSNVTDSWKNSVKLLVNQEKNNIVLLENGEETVLSIEQINDLLTNAYQNGIKEVIHSNNYLIFTNKIEDSHLLQISIEDNKVLTKMISTHVNTYFFLILIEAILFLVLYRSNYKERKHKEKIAFTDPITGGLNRLSFLDQTQHHYKHLQNYSIICLNINNFRHINETRGENIGNQLLKIVYDTIQNRLNSQELICRLSMDHFVILLLDQDQQSINNRLTQYIKEINNELSPLYMGYEVSFSIGGCQILSAHNINIALSHAIYCSKQNTTKNTCLMFNQETEKILQLEYKINEAFDESIKNQDFKIYLQPKVGKENQLEAEALVRYIHPELGMIYPNQFIPLFEKNGKITILDMYVFEKVCQLLRYWIDHDIPPIKISVNVSRHIIRSYDGIIYEDYRKIKEKYQIPNHLIEIELTESDMFEYIELDYIQEVLRGFHDAGLDIAIDDFGFAYSSLTILKDLDVDTVKLDRTFFTNENVKSKTIVHNIISMVHDLGMKVVAEGIEDLSQVNTLHNFECDFIQGYVYSKPLPIEEFENWRKTMKGEGYNDNTNTKK